MSCDNAQELISLLLDGRLPAAERENMLTHADICRDCGSTLASLQGQRALLRKMAETPIPEVLAARLSVLASHERERQLARVNIRERLRRLSAKIDLVFENLMRPVALPVTGGLLSTLLLFALMMPSLSFSHQTGGYDFSTAPQGSLVANPWDQGADDDARDFPRIFASPDQAKSDYVNIVNLTIDESGRVVDWSIVRGQVTDEMKDIILFSHFVPATTFGVRTSGTIQVRQSLPPCKYTSCSATVRG
jgi:anti-sigma factor RsiW